MSVWLRLLAIWMIVSARLGTGDAATYDAQQAQTMRASAHKHSHESAAPSCDDQDDDLDCDDSVGGDDVLVPVAPAIIPPRAQRAEPIDEPATFIARGHQRRNERPPTV